MRKEKKRLVRVCVLTAIAATSVTVGGKAAAEVLAPKQATLIADNLTGDQVVPGPGDPDGYGTAKLPNDSVAAEICWDINTENLTLPITAALIHVGDTGQPGEVFIPLFGETYDSDPDGCRNADPDKLRDLNQKSQDFYLEIGSDDYPEGAVRDQLEHQKYEEF